MTAVVIATPDGRAPAHLFRPEGAGGGSWPAVLFFMDGIGVRPALWQMAGQLARHGYVVLLPDLYYRAGAREPLDARAVLADGPAREEMLALFRSIDGPLVMRDTGAYLDFLAAQEAVRGARIGCVGYCMGGGFALLAAGTYPERIAAAASFHGANLATERPGSPHALAARMRATVYVGVAETDPWLAPGETERLREALAGAGVAHTIEICAGTQHGFAVPDLPVYDPVAAERHRERLRQLFDSTLETQTDQ